eukprot:evm.model.NODE_18903_length_3638_cov_19.405993.2
MQSEEKEDEEEEERWLTMEKVQQEESQQRQAEVRLAFQMGRDPFENDESIFPNDKESFENSSSSRESNGHEEGSAQGRQGHVPGLVAGGWAAKAFAEGAPSGGTFGEGWADFSSVSFPPLDTLTMPLGSVAVSSNSISSGSGGTPVQSASDDVDPTVCGVSKRKRPCLITGPVIQRQPLDWPLRARITNPRRARARLSAHSDSDGDGGRHPLAGNSKQSHHHHHHHHQQQSDLRDYGVVSIFWAGGLLGKRLRVCESMNTRLIDFLAKDDTLEEMVSFLIEPPPPSADDKRVHKYPYMTCEVICCENDHVLDALISMKDGMMLARIFSLLDTEGELDDRLSGYFEKVVFALLRRKCQQLMAFLNGGGLPLFRKFVRHLNNYSIMQVVER